MPKAVHSRAWLEGGLSQSQGEGGGAVVVAAVAVAAGSGRGRVGSGSGSGSTGGVGGSYFTLSVLLCFIRTDVDVV